MTATLLNKCPKRSPQGRFHTFCAAVLPEMEVTLGVYRQNFVYKLS